MDTPRDTPSVTVRRADVRDVLSLRRLWLQMSAETPSPYPTLDEEEITAFTEHLAMVLVQPDHATYQRCWIAEDGDRPVGFFMAAFEARAFGKPRCFAAGYFLYVDPEYRDQGIARALIRPGVDYLESLGLTHIELAATIGDLQWVKRGWAPVLVRHVRSLHDLRQDLDDADQRKSANGHDPAPETPETTEDPDAVHD